jgi:carbamoyl-phosphate synthase large subunit
MPKRTDIHKIMIIGAGPIIIGQACEFDYSGTQACKALKEEGYEVVLVNSNPATIMTDPDFAHHTYIEPITPDIVAKIIKKERPDALLPTLGGQTALNTAVSLAESGVLDQFKVELIGATLPAIKKAEDRNLFKAAMQKIGLNVPRSGVVTTMAEALEVVKKTRYPAIIRPSFTLGGTGGSVAYNHDDFVEKMKWAFDCSPNHQALVEQSAVGWKEYELEVMRDKNDNVVIVCSIENLDPMGVHTGDSITIAPAQTLTDKEYQIMRDAALAIIREIGVDTGGSNIQFAVNPRNGDLIVIEMNPRVSRSSALASKATGFPIAKIATKLAVGYTLDEITNDITQTTPSSFEPSIDYVVTKIPRFTFEKFPQTDNTLTTQMKSVGEAMAIGRTFNESLNKALRSLETGLKGLDPVDIMDVDKFKEELIRPNDRRLLLIAEAMRRQLFSVEEIYKLTAIDPWFLYHIKEIIDCEQELAQVGSLEKLGLDLLKKAKTMGFSDPFIANIFQAQETQVRKLRQKHHLKPVYKMVDTCAAEFMAHTPYLYSTYEDEDEANVTDKKKIMILGGGPNRIGQGIEFDYCCVHASFALRKAGYETIMVNCNPETVSTDYDTSDRLYFEPLTFEDVMHIVDVEKPQGIIVQFGGQTPLKLSKQLKAAGAPIIGTDPEDIDRAEDRKLFAALVQKLGLKQPENGTATTTEEAIQIAEKIGYPVVVRPSYVLGGRAMEIVYDSKYLAKYMAYAVKASPEHPILIDQFLEACIEVDVDAISDGTSTIIAGILEHIEEAGIHSGDSAMCLPPHSLSQEVIQKIREASYDLAKELNVIGLMNIQFAIKNDELYMIEVNPRASRTIPFISKATGIPFAKLAARAMAGETLKELGLIKEKIPTFYSVKESVFPFAKFPGVDTLLGPEMNSTGEVMGIDHSFGAAFAKSQLAAMTKVPTQGTVFMSVRDGDKEAILKTAQQLIALDLKILATEGTYLFLEKNNIPAKRINKVKEGSPHIVDALQAGDIAIVMNTPEGRTSALDSFSIRRTALICNVPYFTTTAAAAAVTAGIAAIKEKGLDVTSIQKYHA